MLIVHIDAHHANAGLELVANKTDYTDVVGLAQIVRTARVKAVHIKSWNNQVVRASLPARTQPAEMRDRLENEIRLPGRARGGVSENRNTLTLLSSSSPTSPVGRRRKPHRSRDCGRASAPSLRTPLGAVHAPNAIISRAFDPDRGENLGPSKRPSRELLDTRDSRTPRDMPPGANEGEPARAVSDRNIFEAQRFWSDLVPTH